MQGCRASKAHCSSWTLHVKPHQATLCRLVDLCLAGTDSPTSCYTQGRASIGHKSWYSARDKSDTDPQAIEMPPAKRLRSSAPSRQQAAPAKTASSTDVPQGDGDGEFASLAKRHWLKTSKRATKVKVKNDVLKRDIWDAIEKDGFQYKSLHALESLQTLERSVSMPYYLSLDVSV